MIARMKLSVRRNRLEDGQEDNPRVADFEYRRDITNDVEAILRDAEVFKPSGDSSLDRYEQNALLRRLAEDIAAYIVQ